MNNDGKVTIEEFKRVMIKTGRVKPEDIEKMIGKADLDDDGYLMQSNCTYENLWIKFIFQQHWS